MRACSAQVDAVHRRARRKPIRPHVPRQAFALKDVASRETDFLLDVRWTKDLRIDHGAGNVATKAGQRMESEPSHFLAAFVPRAVCEFVRHILRKNAHGVLSAR